MKKLFAIILLILAGCSDGAYYSIKDQATIVVLDKEIYQAPVGRGVTMPKHRMYIYDG